MQETSAPEHLAPCSRRHIHDTKDEPATTTTTAPTWGTSMTSMLWLRFSRRRALTTAVMATNSALPPPAFMTACALQAEAQAASG